MNIQIAGIIAAIIAVLALGAWAGKEWEHSRSVDALKAQEQALVTSCNKDKEITKEADNAYQKQVSALNGRIAALLMQPSRCVPVITNSAKRVVAKVKPRPHSANAGITTTFLYQYAGQCEADRLQLNGLIDFVNAVWSRK